MPTKFFFVILTWWA